MINALKQTLNNSGYAAWWRSFYAALAVLLLAKLALMADNVFGSEAYASPGKLLAKLPLLVGNDVLGAGLLATVSLVLCLPLLHRGLTRAAMGLALVIQAAHAFLVAVSYHTTLVVGGPLTKSVIDLATMQETKAAAPGSSPAMWSSISRYLDAERVTIIASAIAVSLLVYTFAPRMPALGGKVRVVQRGLLSALAILGAFILPWLVTGQLIGVRVHTYGLERSAAVELAGSYAGAIIERWSRADGTTSFTLDMSTEDPSVTDINPLRQAKPRKTNVILVSLESVGATYLEDPTVMPFISSIGETPGGVRLAQHYSVWPQTMKAFFSIFCAELPYPRYETIPMVNPSIPCVSVSQALDGAGYDTALVTSADLGYDRKWRFFRHRAFEHVVDMRNIPGREDYWSNSWGVDEKVAVAHILDLMKAPREAPLFIFYELFTAHHPYEATQEHVDNPLSDDKEAYLRALRYIDARMKDMVDGLREQGKLDDTLIVFFSDHGEGFNQHPGSLSHGAKIYQETVHVPHAILGPQLAEISGDVQLPTSHIDIAPTLLGLVGVDVPCTMKGRNLVADSSPRIVLFGGRPPGAQMGLLDGKWKYIIDDSGLEQLFDISLDPGEKTDLADQNAERLKTYKARIEAWRAHGERLIPHYTDVLSESECRP